MPTATDPLFTRRSSNLALLSPSPTSTPSTSSPPPSPKDRTTTFLGLRTPHNPSTILRTLQRYSSYTFAAFLSLHVTNTAVLPLLLRAATTTSATHATQSASTYLLLTRPYYQSFPFEGILAFAFATHVVAGGALRLYKRHVLVTHYGGYTPLLSSINVRADAKLREWRRAPWPRLTWTSVAGYVAVPLVLGHVWVTRGLPLRVEGGSSGVGLDYVSHGYAMAPAISVLGYMGLVAVVGSHVVWGGAKWLELAPGKAVQGEERAKVVRRKRRWWGVWGVVGVVVGVWMAGGIGVVGRAGRTGGWVGKIYDGLYARLPWMV